MLVTLRYRFDIIFCAGKTNLLDEGLAVRGGGTVSPFQDIASSCIIVSQGIRQRIVRPGISFEQFLQIPGTRESIGDGIKKMLRVEVAQMFSIGPILARGFRNDLHQTDFSGPAGQSRIETAFPPYHRFNKRRVNAIVRSGAKNRPILAMFTPIKPAPKANEPAQKH